MVCPPTSSPCKAAYDSPYDVDVVWVASQVWRVAATHKAAPRVGGRGGLACFSKKSDTRPEYWTDFLFRFQLYLCGMSQEVKNTLRNFLDQLCD